MTSSCNNCCAQVTTECLYLWQSSLVGRLFWGFGKQIIVTKPVCHEVVPCWQGTGIFISRSSTWKHQFGLSGNTLFSSLSDLLEIYEGNIRDRELITLSSPVAPLSLVATTFCGASERKVGVNSRLSVYIFIDYVMDGTVFIRIKFWCHLVFVGSKLSSLYLDNCSKQRATGNNQ